jgi:hypothetical protein
MQTAPSPKDGTTAPHDAANVAEQLVPQANSPDLPSSSGTYHRSRCEVGRTLRGGKCGLPGEIEFGGALLCARHAKQAEIYERIDLLNAVVLSTELCLRTVSLRRDRKRALLLRRQRVRAARELELAYEDLRRFENDDP